MSRESTIIKLYDIKNKVLREGILYKDISETNIEDYENKWIPMFEKLRHELENQHSIEDSHWNWRNKMKGIKDLLSYTGFVIEIDNETQGMMLIDSIKTSRIEPQKPITYIEYLATAPWNRAVHSNPRFKLVGKLLIFQAIGESFEKGFQGRVGLHSLPGAVKFYSKLGFINMGKDPNVQNLPYFELKQETAQALIKDL